jgi:DNA-binding response OmpR family regulator
MAKKKQILIVEDEPGTLNLIEQIVMRAGYEPLLARGGKEALSMMQEGGIDLVLLDIKMKDIDGWTVLMTLKADPRSSHVPVIIVTGKTPAEHRAQMKNLAGLYEDYFVKPFEIEPLIAKIAELLQDSPA